MKEKLNLVTYFTKEEIEKIYSYLVEYAIRNYEKNKEQYNGWAVEKYNYAKTLQNKTIDEQSEEIEQFLENKQEKYNQNLEDNKEVITAFCQIPVLILQRNLTGNETNEEILNYIFDFVTNYITYSEDYYKYCIKTPPTKNLEFDFKDLTPTNKDIEGLLVQGQGVCDEIANLICYLGKCFGVKIEKEFCRYKEDSHAINYVLINSNLTYIDATRKIRGQKTKEECFLISREELNKNHEYTFREPKSSITIDKSNIPINYNMPQIINEIKTYLPKITYEENLAEKRSTRNGNNI